jgi:hypothetical protein
MKNNVFLLIILMVSGCAPTGQYAPTPQQPAYFQPQPNPFENIINQKRQIFNSQQPTTRCVTREEFGRLVTECQ